MMLYFLKECNTHYGVVLVRIFSHRTEYGEIWSISPNSVQMRENVDQNNSEYANVLCSDSQYCALLGQSGFSYFISANCSIPKKIFPWLYFFNSFSLFYEHFV